jgi:hypothetical protein
MNMTGWFPGGLQFFPQLDTIILTAGELKGAIPSEAFAQMTNLVKIDLQYNEFSGTFPMAGFGFLEEKIQHINLSYNSLTGSISEDIGRLQDLNVLLVSGNAMTGMIPTSLGNLINLQYLQLNDNSFAGQLPTELGQLVGLTSAWFYGNSFSGAVPTNICTLRAVTEPANSSSLTELIADCRASDGTLDAVAEIYCPVGCCTACCDPSGQGCLNI